MGTNSRQQQATAGYANYQIAWSGRHSDTPKLFLGAEPATFWLSANPTGSPGTIAWFLSDHPATGEQHAS
jgi:hypothetical protein